MFGAYPFMAHPQGRDLFERPGVELAIWLQLPVNCSTCETRIYVV